MAFRRTRVGEVIVSRGVGGGGVPLLYHQDNHHHQYLFFFPPPPPVTKISLSSVSPPPVTTFSLCHQFLCSLLGNEKKNEE